MKISELISKKIAILGFGKEGKSTLSFLEKIGCSNITIHDSQEITSNEYACQTGEKYLESLEKYDTLFLSPGISRYLPEIQNLKEKIISQAQIFFDNYVGKVIAITGTKGKSTTSTLIYEVLKNAGYHVKLVGNIGTPVLSEIDILSEETYDFVVYELSSYMLDGLTKKNYISLLLNIYPDHLDWHHGFENYTNAKLSILRGSEHNLIGYQVEEKPQEGIVFGKIGKYHFENGVFFIDEKKIFDDSDTSLLGEHNRYNICGVLGVCDTIGVNPQILNETLENFIPLRHRLQNIGTFSGITFVDDAISTTPESTIEAINTFDGKVGTIFLGGTDRGYIYEELVKSLRKYKIYNVVLFPPSGEKIKNLLDEDFNIFETRDMQEAINFAFKNTPQGKICLLSTAAPSYSIWKNFEEKGDLFQKHIHEHENI